MSAHVPAAQLQPAKRFRRRVALGVVLLVSLLSWWYWPRGDRRLVGRWSVCDELEPTRVQSTLILKSNGSGRWEFDDCTCLFGWRASTDSLDLGPETPALLRSSLRSVSKAIYQKTHWYMLVEVEDYELLSIAPDEIVLLSKSTVGARRQILRRIEN